MTDEATHPPSLNLLRRQRGHRRGAITRLGKRLSNLYDSDLSDHALARGEAFLRDLDKEVAILDKLQDSVEVAVAEDADALEAEYMERERHNEINSNLDIEGKAFLTLAQAYDLGKVATKRLEDFLSLRDFSSPEVRSQLKALQDLHATFCSKSALSPRSAQLADIATSVKDLLVEAINRVPTTSSTPAATTSTDRYTDRPPPTSRMAPLNVDLPKFKETLWVGPTSRHSLTPPSQPGRRPSVRRTNAPS